jgi:two-component system, OmpR family, response regulator
MPASFCLSDVGYKSPLNSNAIFMSTIAPNVNRWTQRSALALNRMPRVLIVDDYQSGADALASYLGQCRLEVHTVYRGRDAVSAVAQWAPDIVLLDISMPDIDGFAVARALRSNPKASSIVIVALTAHDQIYVKARSQENEFDAYCQKGLALEPLVHLLTDITQALPC